MKTPITEAEYEQLLAQHVALRDRNPRAYAGAFYVYRREPDGAICTQTYSHADHKLTSVVVCVTPSAREFYAY